MTDAGGSVAETTDYSPLGVPTTPLTRTPYHFTGEIRDAVGLQYHRARHYAPALGTWSALDPFEGVMGRPTSLNGYTWVVNNPINRVDPTGMFDWNTGTTQDDDCLYCIARELGVNPDANPQEMRDFIDAMKLLNENTNINQANVFIYHDPGCNGDDCPTVDNPWLRPGVRLAFPARYHDKVNAALNGFHIHACPCGSSPATHTPTATATSTPTATPTSTATATATSTPTVTATYPPISYTPDPAATCTPTGTPRVPTTRHGLCGPNKAFVFGVRIDGSYIWPNHAGGDINAEIQVMLSRSRSLRSPATMVVNTGPEFNSVAGVNANLGVIFGCVDPRGFGTGVVTTTYGGSIPASPLFRFGIEGDVTITDFSSDWVAFVGLGGYFTANPIPVSIYTGKSITLASQRQSAIQAIWSYLQNRLGVLR